MRQRSSNRPTLTPVSRTHINVGERRLTQVNGVGGGGVSLPCHNFSWARGSEIEAWKGKKGYA